MVHLHSDLLDISFNFSTVIPYVFKIRRHIFLFWHVKIKSHKQYEKMKKDGGKHRNYAIPNGCVRQCPTQIRGTGPCIH